MKIKVTDLAGNRISFGRATGRYFLKMVSSFEFMLGYLISFSDQRQTWHDYISKTLVVRKEITFSPYYLMPKISSRWMFDVPFVSRPSINRGQTLAFACIWCDYQSDESRTECPRCGRRGRQSDNRIPDRHMDTSRREFLRLTARRGPAPSADAPSMAAARE